MTTLNFPPSGFFGLGGTGIPGSPISAVDALFGNGSTTGAIADFAGVFSGFSQAQGYNDEANLYGSAVAAARTQATDAQVIGDNELFQLKRKVSLFGSASRAAAANNGLQESGSAADLLRETAMQGAQAEQNQVFSTEMKVDQYNEQAAAAQAQESAAHDAAGGSILGGLFKGAAGIASLAGMF